MRILGVDLGRFNRLSHARLLVQETGETTASTAPTTPEALARLFGEQRAEMVVIEPCTASGWVADLCRSLGVRLLVANTNHPAWKWRNRSEKSDRSDAQMLAQLAAMNQLEAVHVPEAGIREWRGLIGHRAQVVRERVSIQNRIRRICERHGVETARGKTAWTKRHILALGTHAKPLAECSGVDLWRGILSSELERLDAIEQVILRLEDALEGCSHGDPRIARLRTIPGVGPRLAELIVALIDDPKRFSNCRQVAAYAGLVPRRYASGETVRQGRIDKQGNRLLRAYLVEVSWLCVRHNAWARATFQRLNGTSKKGKRRAVVALARLLLIRCWAMLRDGSDWREPSPTATEAVVETTMIT